MSAGRSRVGAFRLSCAGVGVAALVVSALVAAPVEAARSARPDSGVKVSRSVRNDVSRPLRDMVGTASAATPRVHPARPIPRPFASPATPPSRPSNPLVSPMAAMPSLDVDFEGMSNTLPVPPPDTNGDVGPDHYVQMVNVRTQIFDKAGTSLLGPVASNTFFSGFGGPCQDQNDGDPIVKFDRMANRWVITQFAVDQGAPFYQCLAASTTPDPTGSYYRYAFSYDDFPDYAKLGIWPDGYYVTYNMFDATLWEYLGTKSCVFDRDAMLAGAPATQQCFDHPAGPYGDPLLPGDLDGSALPPSGSPNYQVGLNYSNSTSTADEIQGWAFHVDWATPGNSTMSGPALLATDPYTMPCPATDWFKCVPQPDTAQDLSALGDRVMYRLAYRNYGDHESLAVSHSVDAGADVIGVRWYEIRDPGGSPAVYQQGTYSPDTTHRWMPSVAMDNAGDLAAGYSASSSSVYPSIRYAGRLVGDPLGTLPQSEATLIAGSGSQTSATGRWGDYSAMQIDPVDDCTFWYTNEYVATTGVAPWRTRVGSFKFPSCASTPGPPTGASAVAGTGQATVSWTAPIQTGTSPITGYTVTSSPAVFTPATCSGVAANSCVFTGLAAGTSYTFTVAATNSVGTSSASEPSAPVTPATDTQSPVNGCVTAPKSVPRAGKRRLLKSHCLTTAGQAVTVRVSGRRRALGREGQVVVRGDSSPRARIYRVIRKRNGKVVLRTVGKKLRLTITWSAAAVGNYSAYSLTRRYHTRKYRT